MNDRRFALNEHDDEIIARFIQEGMGIREIARRLAVSPSTITRWRQRHEPNRDALLQKVFETSAAMRNREIGRIGQPDEEGTPIRNDWRFAIDAAIFALTIPEAERSE